MTGPVTSPETRLAEEYRALRDAAGVVDLSRWTVIQLLGSETRSFLQGTATQDFETAPPPGRAVPTLFLTEKGRPVAHAWVAFGAPADGEPKTPQEPVTAWLLADEGCRDLLRPHLERFRVMEDVEIKGPEETPRLLGVAGPERDPLAGAIASKIPGSFAIHAEPLSFVLTSPDASPSNLAPFVDPRAFEAWRIREGIPYQGIDFDAERIATELSLPDAISLTKGCYVGQEVVARTSIRGKVRRQRIGFRFPWGSEPFPKGTQLRSGGMDAGFVTSVTQEPGTREGLGMGYLSTEALSANLDILGVRGEKTTLVSLHSWPL